MHKKKAGKPIKPPHPEHGVRFELEADAENLFKTAVDNMTASEGQASLLAKDQTSEPAPSKKKNPTEPFKIDLHGMTLDAARRHVDGRIHELLMRLSPGARATLNIITGKGLNSGMGGGVLAREIPDWVRERFAKHIVDMDESPAEVQLGGIPIRGYFRVTIKG